MGPTFAQISHVNLRHNLALIRRAIGSRKIMAVVKAFAYGHGDLEIAKTACNAGCEYLGVAFVEEGIRLRRAGLKGPILVFGAQLPSFFKLALDYDLELTITSREQIAYLKKLHPGKSKKVVVHLKIDTGMNRVGFSFEQFEDIFQLIKDDQHFQLAGVYSHLATADEKDQSYLDLQITRFREIQTYARTKGNENVLFHLGNSAAIMKKPEAYFDMVRAGIMIYGQPPAPDFDLDWDLKPVLSLYSKLSLIKFVKKNEPISYGRRFYTNNDSYIGIIPIGYADGLSRSLTNKAHVIINNKKYPIVGTVCMDMIMVNLGEVPACNTGDDVIIYGESKNNQISIRDVSKVLNTIPYEITCNVSSRIPRKHVYF